MRRDSRLSGVLHVLLHMAEQDGPVTSEVLARAMATNPTPIIVPCHRVIKSDGSIGNYTTDEVEDGSVKKQELLEAEGIIIKEGKVQELDKVLYDFS